MPIEFNQAYTKIEEFPDLYKKEIENKFNELIELLCKFQYLNKTCGWAWDCDGCKKSIEKENQKYVRGN